MWDKRISIIKDELSIVEYIKAVVRRQQPFHYIEEDFIEPVDRLRCPFHHDEDKSMEIDDGKKEFKCNICREHGDIVELHRIFIKSITGTMPSLDKSIEFLEGVIEGNNKNNRDKRGDM